MKKRECMFQSEGVACARPGGGRRASERMLEAEQVAQNALLWSLYQTLRNSLWREWAKSAAGRGKGTEFTSSDGPLFGPSSHQESSCGRTKIHSKQPFPKAE